MSPIPAYVVNRKVAGSESAYARAAIGDYTLIEMLFVTSLIPERDERHAEGGQVLQQHDQMAEVSTEAVILVTASSVTRLDK